MQSLSRDHLFEHGLVSTFDMISSALGEQDALFSSHISIAYMEMSESSHSIARQLTHRLGVSSGQQVLIECGGHAAAEITAMLACMR